MTEDSIQKLSPAQQNARSWADEQWRATLRTIPPAQWANIMGSAVATYQTLYRARRGSEFPLGKLPVALITTSAPEDAEREAAFSHLSENGWQILASRSRYPSPLEQPELVAETILKVVEMARGNAGR